jgi:hypothetical protein
MTPFEATRAFWFDGLNPYGSEATERIQFRIFGGPPRPEQDPGYFSYPLYATYLIVPVANLEYTWASAIWMVALEVSLIGAMILILGLFRWRPPPVFLGMLLLWTLLFYPGGRGLILGQYSHIVFFLQMLTLWGLSRNEDALAGTSLAISTLKPQMGYLLVPFLLLWAYKKHRWQFIYWFAGIFAGLLAVAFAVFPGWFGEWLNRLNLYTSYTPASPLSIIAGDYLGLDDVGERGLRIILYGLTLWPWALILLKGRDEWLMWTIVWTLTLTQLTAFSSATPHFVTFMIPIVFYVIWIKEHGGRYSTLLNSGILLVILITPWVHFLMTVGGVDAEQEASSVQVAMPVIFLAVMWLTRRMWLKSTADLFQSSAQTNRSSSVKLSSELNVHDG